MLKETQFKITEDFLFHLTGAHDTRHYFQAYDSANEPGQGSRADIQQSGKTLAEVRDWIRRKTAQGWAIGRRLNYGGQKEQDFLSNPESHLVACAVDLDPAKVDGRPAPFAPEQIREILALADALPLPPHLAVFSGSGVHLYWRVKPDEPIQDHKRTQRQLIAFLKRSPLGGLPFIAGIDDCQNLRLPGTLNRKSGRDPVLADLIKVPADNSRLTLAEIRAACPEPLKAPAPAQQRTQRAVWRADDTRGAVIELAQSKARSATEGDRHNTLKAIAPDLFGNLSADEAEQVLIDCGLSMGLPEREIRGVSVWASGKTFSKREKRKIEPSTRSGAKVWGLLSLPELRAQVRATATAYGIDAARADLTVRRLAYYLVKGKITGQDYAALISDYQRLSGIDQEVWGRLAGQAKQSPTAPQDRPRVRPINYTRKADFLPLDEAQAEVKRVTRQIMTERTGDFHVLTVTPGVGKTSAVTAVLQDWERGLWPVVQGNKTSADLRVLFLTDTRAQAEAFYKALAAGRKDNGAPLFAGIKVNSPRDADNCWEFEKLNPDVTDLPGGYCSKCPRRDACKATPGRYIYEREQFKSQRLQIATKDAILHGQFDEVAKRGAGLVILDESLLSLAQSKDLDFDALTAVRNAVNLGLEAEEKHPDTRERILTEPKAKECLKYLDRIIKRLRDRAPGKVLKPAPVLSESELQVIEAWRPDAPAPQRFFSLLQTVNYDSDLEVIKDNGKFKLRLGYLKSQVFNHLEGVTVLNLDATPLNAVIDRFNNVIRHEVKAKENANFYQLCDPKLYNMKPDTAKIKYQFDLANFQALEAIRAGGYQKAGFITYKSDRDSVNAFFAEHLPGVELVLGHWGNDHKATNNFQDCDILILKGGYWQNEQMTRQRARLLGVEPGALAKDLFEADLIQAIGRARAVRKLKPIPILIFNSGAVPGWVSNQKYTALPVGHIIMDFFCVSQSESAFEADNCYRESVKNGHLSGNTSENTADACGSLSQPDLQLIFNTQLTPATICSDFVSGRLADLGFYSHSLAGFTLPPERVTEDMPAAHLSERTYQKLIKPILAEVPGHWLTIESGKTIKIWGSLDAAREYLAPEVTPDTAEPEPASALPEVAERFGSSPQSLGISPTILYELAAPSIPDSVTEEPAAPALPEVYQGRDKPRPGVWSGTVIEGAASAADTSVIAWARQAFSQRPLEVSTAARQLPENTEGLSARELLYSDDRLVLALAAKLITLYPDLDSLPFSPPDLGRFLSPFQRPAGVDWG